jgi:hypothetical protein
MTREKWQQIDVISREKTGKIVNFQRDRVKLGLNPLK